MSNKFFFSCEHGEDMHEHASFAHILANHSSEFSGALTSEQAMFIHAMTHGAVEFEIEIRERTAWIHFMFQVKIMDAVIDYHGEMELPNDIELFNVSLPEPRRNRISHPPMDFYAFQYTDGSWTIEGTERDSDPPHYPIKRKAKEMTAERYGPFKSYNGAVALIGRATLDESAYGYRNR